MKIEKLIQKLIDVQKKHPKIDISLFDVRKNLYNEVDGASSSGIIDDFSVEMIELNKEDAELYEEDYGKPFKSWLALSFLNDDYNDDGDKL